MGGSENFKESTTKQAKPRTKNYRHRKLNLALTSSSLSVSEQLLHPRINCGHLVCTGLPKCLRSEQVRHQRSYRGLPFVFFS
jgi:hypothetical protein